MNKLIIISATVLTVLIIIILIISRWNNPKNNLKVSTTDIRSENQSTFPVNKINNPTVSTLINDKKQSVYPTPPIFDILKITQQLPYLSDNLSIVYSPVLEQIIATYQTEKAEEEFNQWINNQNLSKNMQDLINQRVIVKKNKDETLYQKDAEMVFARNRELSLILAPTITIPTSTSAINNSQTNQTSQSLSDIINLLFDFETPSIISSGTIQPTIDFAFPTETISQSPNTPSPTITPTLYTPIPTLGTPKENATRIVDDNIRLVVPVTAMKNLFNEIGTKVGVPPKIIEGIMQIESQGSLSYSDDKVINYSTPGVLIPGCGPNDCSATGPMQMTIGHTNYSSNCPKCCWNGPCSCPNAWAGFGRAVNTYGGYTHATNPCNLRDSLYAASLKLKNNSGAKSSTSWTKEEVDRAGLRYHGSCAVPFPRLGNRTYCEFLWWYYNRI